MTSYCEAVTEHYQRHWRADPAVLRHSHGPVQELPCEFRVLEFPPTENRSMWAYATCGMGLASDAKPIELYLYSPVQEKLHVELLTVIAHYHRTGARLDLGHTVNFGRPWLSNSLCEFGLISLPYLDGPCMERLDLPNPVLHVKCYWLIPITRIERDFKSTHGCEALEVRFENAQFNYLDPHRECVVT